MIGSYDYTHIRFSESIVEYLTTQSQPESFELKSHADLEKARVPNKPFILTYTPTSNDPMLDVHRAIAAVLRPKAIFAHTHDKSLLATPVESR